MNHVSGLRHVTWSVAMACLLLGAILVPNGEAQETNVVFLAGPKDHGAPGRHEYERDLSALAWALENATNLEGVTTEVRVGKAPRDLDEIRDASVVVLYSSGDWLPDETHVLFPPFTTTDGRRYDDETAAYLDEFDELVKSGVGFVIFHYTLWAENWVARSHYMDWIGGLWLPRGSVNPSDTWHMEPLAADHPILNDISAWDYRDEVFTRFLLPMDPSRTDLMLGTPERSQIGTQVVAWAYERPDGGRSFVWGGSDFNDNMYSVDDYRQFLLNGIVWAAGRDVPEEGVQAPTPPAP
jgi:type 1 glutamine amidotransferase